MRGCCARSKRQKWALQIALRPTVEQHSIGGKPRAMKITFVGKLHHIILSIMTLFLASSGNISFPDGCVFRKGLGGQKLL